MFHVSFARLTVAALVLYSVPVAAESIELDLRGAIDRAHRAAPDAVAARGRVAEAEAAVVEANVAFTSNPEVDVGAGPRFASQHPVDAEVRIEQELEPWRREPRRALARAEVARARGEASLRLRDLDLEVALAFCESLSADREVDLATRAADLAARGADAADRRRKAGDITDLDANLASAARGRARAAVAAAASERAIALGKLAALIGAAPDDTVTLRGDLRSLGPPVALPAVALRPDVRALELERDAATAERAHANAHGRPGVAIWLGYQREDTTDIVLAGLRLSLPVWNHGQGELALASAKQRRASEARDATARMATREIADALAAYRDAQRSVEVFEQEVVPALDDSERLLDKTLGAGQIAVSDYLFARQELLNGRREHLQRLLALAKAAVAARYAAGVSP